MKITLQKYRKYLVGGSLTLGVLGIAAVSTLSNLKGELVATRQFCAITPAPFCTSLMTLNSKRFTKIYVSGTDIYGCAKDGYRYKLILPTNGTLNGTVLRQGTNQVQACSNPQAGTSTQAALSALIVSNFAHTNACTIGPVSFTPTGITSATPIYRNGNNALFAANSGAGTLYTCKLPVCGNNAKESNEQCDDGNQINTDACTNVCKSAACKDGFLQGTEQCDDGNQNDADGCSNSCTLPRCTDNIIQPAGVDQITGNADDERCDDGNQINTDSCSNSCKTPVCLDGILNQTSEQCDDGNQINTDSCSNICKTPVCLDGILNQTSEQCDDGNQNDTDSCNNLCKVPVCGDGIVNQTSEQCDDSNNNENDDCTTACIAKTTDLSIVKTMPTTLIPHDLYQVRLMVTNSGSDTARNIVVTDRLPEGATLRTPNSNFTCTATGSNLIVCTSAQLNARTRAELVFAYNFDVNECPRTLLNEPATVSASTHDPNMSNNQSHAAATTLNCSQPQITLSSAAVSGATLVVTYSKNFSSCATLVTEQYQNKGGSFCNAGENIMQTRILSSLNVSIGQKVRLCHGDTFSICSELVTVIRAPRCGDGAVHQTSEQCDDNNSNDDDDCTNACIAKIADVSIQKTGPADIMPYEIFTYTLAVSNAGPDTARNVVVTDTMPRGAAFHSVDPTGSCSKVGTGSVVCSGITLASGQSRQIKINYIIYANTSCPSDAVPNTFATISTSTNDSNMSNNSSKPTPATLACTELSLALSSVEINSTASTVTFSFNKNFTTCLHVLNDKNQIIKESGYYCGQGTQVVTQTLANVPVTESQKVRLCHGNNYNICSGLVTVTRASVCGDGARQGAELCDDGNQNNNDGCSNACTTICGDGFVKGDEQCDDGNMINTDSCTNICKFAICGDGFNQGAEQCDDGNQSNSDTCTNLCRAALCGDTFIQGTEQCDDGNINNSDMCSNACRHNNPF